MALLQIIGSIVLVLSLSIVAGAVRRLFFHPISHIPGPKLAALTWWYEFYFDGIQPGRYVFKIQELHKKYGPIIRVTPDEIHIEDVGFLDSIYSSSPRDKYSYQLRSLRVPGGVGAATDHEVHKKRRDALAPFFSKRNIVYLEPLIKEKVDQLCSLVDSHAAEKTSMNLSDVLFGFTNDVAVNFLYATKVDVLADEKKSATLRHNSYSLIEGINLNKHFPWIPDFLESLPRSISMNIMPPGLIDLLELGDRVRAELLSVIKSKSSRPTTNEGKYLGPTKKASVYDSVLDNPHLPPHEKELLRLEQEGTLLVLAGTESPAKSLNVILYHLLANPPILQRLRDELSTVSKTASWSQLEKLPYLGAVIEEGHRLSFGVTARTARIAHQTLTYTPTPHATYQSTISPGKPYKIPAGTPMSTTTLSAHTTPSVFRSPLTFDPERWLGDEGRERRKYQMAFGKGSRRCLGIELASAEVCLVTAALVRRFDMQLCNTDGRQGCCVCA